MGVLPGGDALATVQLLILALSAGAANRVKPDRQRETDPEGDGQGVLVEPQHERRAVSHRPGRTRFVAVLARVLVLRSGLVEGSRFCRTLLDEEGGEEHVHA